MRVYSILIVLLALFFWEDGILLLKPQTNYFYPHGKRRYPLERHIGERFR